MHIDRPLGPYWWRIGTLGQNSWVPWTETRTPVVSDDGPPIFFTLAGEFVSSLVDLFFAASVLRPLSSEPIWLSWFARPGLWPETVLTFVFPIFITLFLDSSFLDSDLSLRSDSPETLLHWIRTNIGNLGIFLNKLLPYHACIIN